MTEARKKHTYYFADHAKDCDPKDYWGQVKRTINGKPIPKEQIILIVAAIIDGLKLEADDTFLDLCCGNGALTTYVFAKCNGGLGVDFSEYLIGIARDNFVKRPEEAFVNSDVVKFVRTCPYPERFTKALCYGSLQYLSQADASDLLSLLRQRFTRLQRVFIGNMPDKGRINMFFGDRQLPPGEEDSPSTAIGIWRTPEEFSTMAKQAGWQCTVSRMPENYYARHYRFDAILVPA